LEEFFFPLHKFFEEFLPSPFQVEIFHYLLQNISDPCLLNMYIPF
jgi:hypothetical protein